jgi:hypothetical protein
MKIRKRKQTGDMMAEYNNSLEVKTCRYRILHKIVENESCVTLIVDTNQRVKAQPVEQVESYLLQAGINHISMLTKANTVSFFGFKYQPNKQKNEERILVMEISGAQFTQELYSMLESYDIAIGFGRQKTLNDMCEYLRVNDGGVLFNPTFFKESIYDSVVCSSLRSTMDIEKYIEAASNETAL